MRLQQHSLPCYLSNCGIIAISYDSNNVGFSNKLRFTRIFNKHCHAEYTYILFMACVQIILGLEFVKVFGFLFSSSFLLVFFFGFSFFFCSFPFLAVFFCNLHCSFYFVELTTNIYGRVLP
jgi:hypothetical protein